MPAMRHNTEWKLDTQPETEVRVGEDVLALRAPLVRVHRDASGTWSFDGPGTTPRPGKKTLLGAVVGAWPHVAGLSNLDADSVAVWSWQKHGWSTDIECPCGECDRPVPADLDRRSWPSELDPDHLVGVEQTALSGQVGLTEIVSTSDGIAFLGPGQYRRTKEQMTTVALANAIRRWPHTMQALRALTAGRGMRWDANALNWNEYVIK